MSIKSKPEEEGLLQNHQSRYCFSNLVLGKTYEISNNMLF